MKKGIILALCLLLLVYCKENIKNKPMTQENLDKLKNSKELTVEEVSQLQLYILKKAFENNGNIIDSTITIGQAINEGKKLMEDDSIGMSKKIQ